MNSALALVPVLVFLPVVAILLPVLSRLTKPCKISELTAEWFEAFDPAQYRPMQGLLTDDDFKFLRCQPGFDPSLHRKLRRDRLRIFRQYLNRLIVDFNRLHAIARLVISQGREDQSELFGQLLKLRFQFWLAIIQVEFNYHLCRCGSQSISVGSSIQRLEEMSRHLMSLPQTKSLFAH